LNHNFNQLVETLARSNDLSTRWLKLCCYRSKLKPSNVFQPKSKPANASAKSLKPSPSAKSNEKCRAIVRAAYQTLAEKGFEGLRMREIAKRAGIDHSTLHYYFSGKEALIDGVVDHIVQDLAIGRPPMENAEIAPREIIAAHFDALVRQMEQTPEMFVVLVELHSRAMREPALRAIFAKNDRAWKGFLVEILQAGIQKNEFPATLVPEVAADVIISMVRGLSTTFAGRAALMKRPLQQLLLWLEGGGAGSAAKRART
jgi:AcrR family transcriptional regulator